MATAKGRQMAFEVLLRVERDRAFADELLHSRRTAGLGAGEMGFVTEAVLGCLRRQGELDHLITARTGKPARALDPEVLVALRLGAYQLRRMTSVPSHAAVWESVELVKRARKRSAAGLVNAVLRNLPPAPRPARAATLSHPGWLVDRWRANLGNRRCEALLRANLERPQTYFRIPAPSPVSKVLKRLERAGVAAEETNLPRAFQLRSGTVAAARRAARARLEFQDLNSQRVGALLHVRPGQRVLDVCAAPGGKSRLLAESAAVISGDRHLRRLRTMRRLGAERISLLALDAERPLPLRAKFHRILVDAPCSGTGTLARNPEIKWRLRPEDLAALHARQARILGNALNALASGGVLIYATCSLEPEENQQVVDAVAGPNAGCAVRQALSTVPGSDPGDGFQAWRIHRTDG